MPTIRLFPATLGPPLPLEPVAGGTIRVPRVRFQCLLRLPQFLMPRDGVIDTGAPLTCLPKSIWDRFREGTDFEWLPFEAGYQPPVGQTVGWRYTFRMARFLVPLTLMDYSTEVERAGLIAQFADSDPPARRGQALPLIIVGLWGGILEGSQLAITRDPTTGQVAGELAVP